MAPDTQPAARDVPRDGRRNDRERTGTTREEERREEILAAAFVQFSRYGFRRTSMEDIARETGLSRASLYRHFSNKEEIFQSLARRLHEDAITAAEIALGSPGTLADRVRDALESKCVRFLEIVHGSPHGAELMDESSRQCGDLAAESDARLRKLIGDAIRAAVRTGEIDLAASGLSAPATAELLVLSAYGLKHGTDDVASFRRSLEAMIRVFFAGIAGLGSAAPR